MFLYDNVPEKQIVIYIKINVHGQFTQGKAQYEFIFIKPLTLISPRKI